MKLTPELVTKLEELNLERAAVDRTYELALNFHRSCTLQIEAQSKEFWKTVGELFKIDITKSWIIKKEGIDYNVVESEPSLITEGM